MDGRETRGGAKRKLGAAPVLLPMPAVLVGTYCGDGTPNAMTAAWAAACCHKPPCLGVAVRKNRLTFANIGGRGAFTINVPDARLAEQVDALGIVSGKQKSDKLARFGLSASRSSAVDAPGIDDCPVIAECRLSGRLDLGSHTWFVGEVLEVRVDEAVLDPDGKIDVDRLDPLAYCTSERAYRRVGESLGAAYHLGERLAQKP
mgnify:CR=1 FL=1